MSALLNDAVDIRLGQERVASIYKGEKLVYPMLPEGYQLCKYIEATGNQYIDTGVYLQSSPIKVITDVVSNSANFDISIFGCVATRNNASNSPYAHVTPYANAWYIGCNGMETHCGEYSNKSGIEYHIQLGPTSFSVNGTLLKTDIYVIQNGNLNIARRGSYSQSSQSYRYGKWKYKTFSVYNGDSNERLRNFIPCLDSDEVPCMYDTVTKAPFYNIGYSPFLYELA